MKKDNGHVLVECILSMSTVAMISITMTPILKNTYDLNLKNKESIKMISILTNEMEIYKNKIKTTEINDKVEISKNINEYNLKINIDKDKEFKNSYLMEFDISKGKNSLNIKAYETKQ